MCWRRPMECGNWWSRGTAKLLSNIVLFGCLIRLLGQPQLALAQWISHGPYGGSVKIIAIDPQTPSTLYAGSDGGGVFRSSNGGGNWTAVSSGLTYSDPENPLSRDVEALAIDPQTPSTLYAGTFGGGVFKSSNGGGNWTATNT